MAQPTPPDNKCDSLAFLNFSLSNYDGTTALIFVFKNNSQQYITEVEMKLEPTEMSGLVFSEGGDESSHPNVAPGQVFSLFFFLENNFAELDLNLDVSGEIITLPKENEFKCEIEFDNTLVNPALGINEYNFSSINLYPNPAHDRIVIPNAKSSANYKLYDIGGREMPITSDFNGTDWILSWDVLQEGFYMLREDKTHSYQKIWIQ